MASSISLLGLEIILRGFDQILEELKGVLVKEDPVLKG